MKRLSVVTAIVVVLGCAAAFAQERIITIGTGSVNGVYYPAGGAICRLMNRGHKDHGVRCFSESTGGTINNLQALRNGDISFALGQSDWLYKAYRGEGMFSDNPPFTEMRSVFSLHSEMFTVAVTKDSGIHAFSELKGKRVNIGDPGSGMRETMMALMAMCHWKNSSFAATTEMKPAEAAQALCKGKIDAMVFAVGHPNGLIQEITSQCGAKLIPVEGKDVEALLAKNPYYAQTIIPGGMYQGTKGDIQTFGVKAALVTTASMDEETVYQLTKSVFENFESFKTLHFVFATLDRERMVNSGQIAPIHPGALRYYKEVGLIKE